MPPQKILLGIILTLILVMAVLLIAQTFPFGPDWIQTYRPAARELMAGRNPHDLPHPRFLNTTWTLLPILPLALMPVKIGGAVFLMMSLAGFAYSAYRLGATPITMGLFMASPPVMHCILNGNIDWFPLLGVTMPPQLGLFFVTAKPQIGLTISLFWLVDAWRVGGWREVVRVFAPVTLALLLTFVLYGFWFTKWTDQPTQWWNASLVPWSIPPGLYLMYLALQKRDIKYALPAGPALSPYVIFHSWSAAVIAVVSSPRWTAIVVGGLWLLLILRAAGST